MIFSAPRFVVVDDKKEHLKAITETFQRLGTSCLAVHYDPSENLEQRHFRGVRCLFMDLHLVDGSMGTDNRRHYSTIANILETNIGESGGPFILVVWTEHPQLSDELKDYLDSSIVPEKAHARPLAVLSLSKEKFINVNSGEVNASAKLRDAVMSAVTSNPQLAALLGWETDVLAAAGDTLASLLNLVPPDQRTSDIYPDALDTILSRLAREAVGQPHVDINHRAAISKALAPILIDRVMNQNAGPEAQEIWQKAVTKYDERKPAKATANEAGNINRMLHFAIPGNETIRSTDWGSVVSWPFGWTDKTVAERLGLCLEEIMGKEFKIENAAFGRCKPVLIRIGAACDYAQDNDGLISFLFGLEIPEDAPKKKGEKHSKAIWESPVFMPPGSAEPSRLFAHIRFPMSFVRADCSAWQSLYRLREQLLMQLISAASSYVSRPGIVQLPTK